MKSKTKKRVPQTLLSAILERLHTTANPVLRLREIESHPEVERRREFDEGVLVEDQVPEIIPNPRKLGSGEFVGVRETARGFEAVATGDEFFSPFLLEDCDVRQFRISLPALIGRLRSENAIDGTDMPADGGLITVGQKVLEGYGTIEVYCALPNDDPTEFAARCRGIRQLKGIKKIAVLVPRLAALTHSQRQILDNNNVILVPLIPLADRGTLAIDWNAVIAGPAAALSDGIHAPDTLVWKGREHKRAMTRMDQSFLALAMDEQYLDVARVMNESENALWGEHFRNTKSQRDKISQFLLRVNNKLAKAKPPVPLSFSLKRGDKYIQRQILNISIPSPR